MGGLRFSIHHHLVAWPNVSADLSLGTGGRSVAVLGAGMVGVSCALALQQRGLPVVLVDRQAPGQGTSYGNAGVFATSSVIPFNHPQIWRSLPRLLGNRSAQFRYRLPVLLRRLPWLARFLWHARPAAFQETARALHALIGLSIGQHKTWMQQAGVYHRLRAQGWLVLHRQPAPASTTAWSRSIFDQLGISYECLGAAEIKDLEPALRPIFSHGLWLKDSASVDDPAAVVQAYANLFAARGGQVLRHSALSVSKSSGTWKIDLSAHDVLNVTDVVVALGPWSASFLLQHLNLRVPLAYERGYHQHFSLLGAHALSRPFYDAAGAYVASPMDQGLRLSSGVEFNDLDAGPQIEQWQQAESAAREAMELGPAQEPARWLGSRPSLPDSRPMIGESRRHPRLWMAFGHQHIGLSTGAGTGEVLADLVCGRMPSISAKPFCPSRFYV